MQKHYSAPRCAPYSVFSDGHLVGRAQDIVQLFEIVDSETRKFYERRESHIKSFRARHPSLSIPILAMPVYPCIRILDGRGQDRDEFSASWKIINYFGGCSPSRLGAMIDHGWDGDHRPRGRPVPGTGKGTSYSRMYYRRPRTQSERRQSFTVVEDDEPAIRKSRRASGMPTFWDDLPRKGWRDRSWKRYRSHQWKPR